MLDRSNAFFDLPATQIDGRTPTMNLQ